MLAPADLRFWHQQESAEGEDDKFLWDMHPHGELPCHYSSGAFQGSPNSLLAHVKLTLPSDRHAALCALQPPEMMTEGQLTPATDVW